MRSGSRTKILVPRRGQKWLDGCAARLHIYMAMVIFRGMSLYLLLIVSSGSIFCLISCCIFEFPLTPWIYTYSYRQESHRIRLGPATCFFWVVADYPVDDGEGSSSSGGVCIDLCPRDEVEIETVLGIFAAGVEYMTGSRMVK